MPSSNLPMASPAADCRSSPGELAPVVDRARCPRPGMNAGAGELGKARLRRADDVTPETSGNYGPRTQPGTHAAAASGPSFRRFRLITPAEMSATRTSTGRGSRNVYATLTNGFLYI